MPLRIDESQDKMTVRSPEKVSRFRKCLRLVVVTGLCAAGLSTTGLGAASARAQENPFRSLTDALGLTTESGQGADFVRQSRPDLDKIDYSKVNGPEKKRVPVRTPAEVEADKSELVAERDKANTRLKKLNGEKMDAVAPNKPPPPLEDHF